MSDNNQIVPDTNPKLRNKLLIGGLIGLIILFLAFIGGIIAYFVVHKKDKENDK